MLWHLLKYVVVWFFPIFFKRIRARNIDYLNTDAPIIIAMNHPNSFADPILLTWVCYPPVRPYYLARGDAFKPGLVANLLQSIGIIPIFRIGDAGKEGLAKNNATYQLVNKLLAKGQKVIVFAEGLCVIERRLRPLKKGVSRMVFGAMEEINRADLLVVPIGVNYDAPTSFRSQVFFNVGEPIKVADYFEKEGNTARNQKLFLDALQAQMKTLITHIDNKENDRFVEQVEVLTKTALMKEKKWSENDLWLDFQSITEITERVNKADEESLLRAKASTSDYFNCLEENKLSDEAMNPIKNMGLASNLMLRWLVVFIGIPPLLIGFVANFWLMALTHRLASTLIKAREFYTSLVLALGSFLFSLYYLLLFLAIKTGSDSALTALLFTLLAAFCGVLSLYLYPFLIKSLMLTKLLFNKQLKAKLMGLRTAALNDINKF
jgi:1-acyl-sn-glycerol-3-phosphate acyltransferase/lipid-A-disaccharide synthase-like uncharacterized protein